MLAGDGNCEICFPVGAEIQKYSPPDLRDVAYATFYQGKPINLGFRSPGVENQIVRNAPDAVFLHTRRIFMEKHFVHKGSVVGKAIDPCETLFQHLPLDPRSVFGEKMGEQAVVAIDVLTAESKGDRTAEHQTFKGLLCFIGKWPFFEPGASQR